MTSDTSSSAAQSRAGAPGRYAAALFDLAGEAGVIDGVETDLKALGAAIGEGGDFAAFLKSPVYGRDDKEAAIAAIADRFGFQALTQNFLRLLAQKGRLFALDTVVAIFRQMAAEHRGEVSAEAISAAPLSDEQHRRLRGEIEGLVGKAVNLATTVDPELLGGLVVKVGSTMIDSSLRTKLNKLKAVMKEA